MVSKQSNYTDGRWISECVSRTSFGTASSHSSQFVHWRTKIKFCIQKSANSQILQSSNCFFFCCKAKHWSSYYSVFCTQSAFCFSFVLFRYLMSHVENCGFKCNHLMFQYSQFNSLANRWLILSSCFIITHSHSTILHRSLNNTVLLMQCKWRL